MRHSTVAAVVVNWNGGENLRRCVASLLAQTQVPKRILVIDNASSDNSLDGLTTFGDAIEIHRLAHNTGFAAANNFAIRKAADCEWVALLNPDAFAKPEWLAELLDAAAAHREFSFFASRILNDADPRLLDGAGDGYHFSGWPGRRGHGLTAAGRYLKQEEVFAPCAAAAMYRRDVLLEVGGFDESFFCYMEDVDLGFRLRLRGHRCFYVPTAIVSHVGSGTTGKDSDVSIYYGHRNLVWTFLKNMPLPLLAIFFLPHLFMNLIVIFGFLLKGKHRIILASKWSAVKGVRLALEQRREFKTNLRGSLRKVASMLSFWPYK